MMHRLLYHYYQLVGQSRYHSQRFTAPISYRRDKLRLSYFGVINLGGDEIDGI